MEINEIGKLVVQVRKASGLTQIELARLAGVGKAVVFDIEKGKQTVQLQSLYNVLTALNIELKLIPPIPLSRSEDV